MKILIVRQIGKSFNESNKNHILSCLMGTGLNLYNAKVIIVQIPIKENGNVSKQKDRSIRNRVRNEGFNFVALWKIKKEQIWGDRTPKVCVKEFPE